MASVTIVCVCVWDRWTCVASSGPVSLCQRAQSDRVTARPCLVYVTLHSQMVEVTVAHLQGKCMQSHLVAENSMRTLNTLLRKPDFLC